MVDGDDRALDGLNLNLLAFLIKGVVFDVRGRDRIGLYWILRSMEKGVVSEISTISGTIPSGTDISMDIAIGTALLIGIKAIIP